MTNTENTTVTQALQNSDLEEFDLVILGGGTGSTVAAWTFAGRGQRVAVIERKVYRWILGFTAFGVGGGEVMTSVQIAMSAALPYTALRDAILTHPTLVEGLIPLFSSVPSAHSAAGAARASA
jgi:pyruvate/2-oxoglutarate dehydrogenase complex dihydrolipoamide dehydrogenase (E3) component